MNTLTTITEKDIEQRALDRHEPRWLRQERVNAWKQFQSLPDPDWRRTKIPKVDLEKTVILKSDVSPEPAPLKIENKAPENASGKIVLVDGEILRISLKPELALKGVLFSDMKTAVLERADLLEKYKKNSSQDKFDLLHTSLWQNGYFLFIPKGVKIDEPFQVQIIQKSFNSILNKNIIILDENSEAVVEEIFESENSDKDAITHFTSTDVYAEKNSGLKYYSVQNWAKNVYDVSSRILVAKKDARIKSLFSILGGSAGRTIIAGDALETGASIEHNGITIGNEEQKFKIVASMNHQAEHTEGLMHYQGILKDRSYSYLDGLIRVLPQGKKTSSRLEEHTLILGSKAKCDALPALDIQTSDVQVSHSASVSKADDEKIFYAMSRGLSEEEARNIIIEGFFENLLQVIQDPQWYEKLKGLIEAKLFISPSHE
jgi:Fe-S cluster assembly scaffold protein SufB